MRKKPPNINGIQISPQKEKLFNGNNSYKQYYQYNNTYCQSKKIYNFINNRLL